MPRASLHSLVLLLVLVLGPAVAGCDGGGGGSSGAAGHAGDGRTHAIATSAPCTSCGEGAGTLSDRLEFVASNVAIPCGDTGDAWRCDTVPTVDLRFTLYTRQVATDEKIALAETADGLTVIVSPEDDGQCSKAPAVLTHATVTFGEVGHDAIAFSIAGAAGTGLEGVEIDGDYVAGICP